MLNKRNVLTDVLFLMGTYVVSILIVNPIGDFPLNDDWCFARAVQGLLHDGDWRPLSFTGMALITQGLWGAIFSALAGFSFNALRASTLILSLTGILGVYVLCITNDRDRTLALAVAFTLGFNPIYYELSMTFMTDVPFTVLAILSAIFFVRCIRRFSDTDLSIACALAVAATLCRQLGLFLPLAFAIALVVQHGFARKWLPRAILPAIVCVTALLLFDHWMSSTGRTPALYGISMGGAGSLSVRGISSKTCTALLYLGLFCLPILVLGSNNPQVNSNSAILRVLPDFSGGLFAVFSVYIIFSPLAYALSPAWMPASRIPGNILIPQGLGPLSIRGSYERLPSLFWGAVTILSVVGGVLLVRGIVASSVVLIQKMRTPDMGDEDIVQVFCLAAVGTYALPILMSPFFDRYLVPLVPFGLYLSAGGLQRDDVGATIRKSVSVALIAFLAVFAVLGTRDYLTWNRVRWEALADLQQTARVSPDEIDGGFEYNGWFHYDQNNKREWWVEDDKYMIAFSKMPGFQIVNNYEYLAWMPPKGRALLLLKRDIGNQ
jgi:hypothetical protein